MPRRLATILLAAAFLVAQAGGIAHQAWHDVHPLASHAGTDAGSDGKAPQKSLLCDFHTALGTVLGALSGTSALAQAVPPAAIAFIAADVPTARFSTFAPQSRAPPALL